MLNILVNSIELLRIAGEEVKKKLSDVIENWDLNEDVKSKLKKNIDEIKNGDLSDEELAEVKKAFIVINIIAEIQKNVEKGGDEMLKGAHIMIEDGGALYHDLEQISKSRISSHHKSNKDNDDMSFQAGNIFNEVLFGKTKDGKTWIQLEAHSLGGLYNLLAHLMDYLIYKITGKNVGQYGLSDYKDSNPISVTKDMLMKKAEVADPLWQEKVRRSPNSNSEIIPFKR